LGSGQLGRQFQVGVCFRVVVMLSWLKNFKRKEKKRKENAGYIEYYNEAKYLFIYPNYGRKIFSYFNSIFIQFLASSL
jgi:hypothetical protein